MSEKKTQSTTCFNIKCIVYCCSDVWYSDTRKEKKRKSNKWLAGSYDEKLHRTIWQMTITMWSRTLMRVLQGSVVQLDEYKHDFYVSITCILFYYFIFSWLDSNQFVCPIYYLTVIVVLLSIWNDLGMFGAGLYELDTGYPRYYHTKYVIYNFINCCSTSQ